MIMLLVASIITVCNVMMIMLLVASIITVCNVMITLLVFLLNASVFLCQYIPPMLSTPDSSVRNTVKS